MIISSLFFVARQPTQLDKLPDPVWLDGQLSIIDYSIIVFSWMWVMMSDNWQVMSNSKRFTRG